MVWTIVWLAGFLLVLRPLSTWAAPGDPDPTFDDDGHAVVFPGNMATGVPRALVLQADGKLIAGGGSFNLARFHTDGTLDSGFGNSGWASAAVGSSPFLHELFVQPDGKIIGAGCASDQQALARWDADGVLDGTFGTAGVVLTSSACVQDLALQSDGKFVGVYSVFPSADFNVVRLEADGDLDPGFGTGGVATVTVGEEAHGGGIAVQPDGMIVVAGTSLDASGPVPVLARLDSGGVPDPGFGSGGIATDVVPASLSTIIVAPDGKLIAAAATGYGEFEPFLPTGIGFVRFHADGQVDLRASVDLAAVIFSVTIVREPAGALLVGATAHQGAANNDAVLARFAVNGSLDPGFGSGGVVQDTFGFNQSVDDLVLQPDGKPVNASGFPTSPVGVIWALTRYLGAEPALCGDSFVEGEEACDDGNTEDGDCCSSACAFEPADTPCPDAAACNGEETCDGAGECAAGTPLDCADTDPCTQDSCDEVLGCLNDDEPAAVCKAAGKSILVIKNNDNDQRDMLIWKWRKGAAATPAEIGDPTTTTDYTLCLYGGGASFGSIDIPADGLKWSSAGAGAYRYADPSGAAGGARRMKIQGGDEGDSKILLKAKGMELPDGLLPVPSPPITLQLVGSDTGACFGSTFDMVDASESSDGLFKAKED